MVDRDALAFVIADVVKAATAPLLARIAVLEARAVVAGEPGPPGRDGVDGAPGKDGRDGMDGLEGPPGRHGKDGEPGLRGEKGMDGAPGRDGRDGMPGAMGEKGIDGKDGVHGRDGIDGKDGLGFDDFEEDLEDDGRVIVRRYRSGDRVKEFRHQTAWLIYRDVYRPGQTYERGDVVTWGNQSWVCREATSSKPGEGSAWRLMVRKGGDGKTGPQGPQGPSGLKGEQGPMGPARY